MIASKGVWGCGESKKHIEIEAPLEVVFEYMGDPRNLLDTKPSIAEVENIQEEQQVLGTYD